MKKEGFTNTIAIVDFVANLAGILCRHVYVKILDRKDEALIILAF